MPFLFLAAGGTIVLAARLASQFLRRNNRDNVKDDSLFFEDDDAGAGAGSNNKADGRGQVTGVSLDSHRGRRESDAVLPVLHSFLDKAAIQGEPRAQQWTLSEENTQVITGSARHTDQGNADCSASVSSSEARRRALSVLKVCNWDDVGASPDCSQGGDSGNGSGSSGGFSSSGGGSSGDEVLCLPPPALGGSGSVPSRMCDNSSCALRVTNPSDLPLARQPSRGNPAQPQSPQHQQEQEQMQAAIQQQQQLQLTGSLDPTPCLGIPSPPTLAPEAVALKPAVSLGTSRLCHASSGSQTHDYYLDSDPHTGPTTATTATAITVTAITAVVTAAETTAVVTAAVTTTTAATACVPAALAVSGSLAAKDSGTSGNSGTDASVPFRSCGTGTTSRGSSSSRDTSRCADLAEQDRSDSGLGSEALRAGGARKPGGASDECLETVGSGKAKDGGMQEAVVAGKTGQVVAVAARAGALPVVVGAAAAVAVGMKGPAGRSEDRLPPALRSPASPPSVPEPQPLPPTILETRAPDPKALLSIQQQVEALRLQHLQRQAQALLAAPAGSRAAPLVPHANTQVPAATAAPAANRAGQPPVAAAATQGVLGALGVISPPSSVLGGHTAGTGTSVPNSLPSSPGNTTHLDNLLSAPVSPRGAAAWHQLPGTSISTGLATYAGGGIGLAAGSGGVASSGPGGLSSSAQGVSLSNEALQQLMLMQGQHVAPPVVQQQQQQQPAMGQAGVAVRTTGSGWSSGEAQWPDEAIRAARMAHLQRPSRQPPVQPPETSPPQQQQKHEQQLPHQQRPAVSPAWPLLGSANPAVASAAAAAADAVSEVLSRGLGQQQQQQQRVSALLQPTNQQQQQQQRVSLHVLGSLQGCGQGAAAWAQQQQQHQHNQALTLSVLTDSAHAHAHAAAAAPAASGARGVQLAAQQLAQTTQALQGSSLASYGHSRSLVLPQQPPQEVVSTLRHAPSVPQPGPPTRGSTQQAEVEQLLLELRQGRLQPHVPQHQSSIISAASPAQAFLPLQCASSPHASQSLSPLRMAPTAEIVAAAAAAAASHSPPRAASGGLHVLCSQPGAHLTAHPPQQHQDPQHHHQQQQLSSPTRGAAVAPSSELLLCSPPSFRHQLKASATSDSPQEPESASKRTQEWLNRCTRVEDPVSPTLRPHPPPPLIIPSSPDLQPSFSSPGLPPSTSPNLSLSPSRVLRVSPSQRQASLARDMDPRHSGHSGRGAGSSHGSHRTSVNHGSASRQRASSSSKRKRMEQLLLQQKLANQQQAPSALAMYGARLMQQAGEEAVPAPRMPGGEAFFVPLKHGLRLDVCSQIESEASDICSSGQSRTAAFDGLPSSGLMSVTGATGAAAAAAGPSGTAHGPAWGQTAGGGGVYFR